MACKKIVIIGPESTGKSTLCEGLAAHYHTTWAPEYAREYMPSHGGTQYTYDDLSTIARGQLAIEDKAAAGNTLLFIDTDLYVMKVWSEYVFGRCEAWILQEIAVRHYDGYLLCRTDLPWVKDELREYPDLASRERLFHIYRDVLINQSVPWAEVGGLADTRLKNAIGAVDHLLH